MASVGECYRVLGLESGASLAQIKTAYRRLARLYHPDLNPGDRAAAEKFVRLHEAYKQLLAVVPAAPASSGNGANPAPPKASKPPKATVRVKRKPRTTGGPEFFRENPNLNELERRLKRETYQRLQYWFHLRRFPRAIASIEALAARLPEDAEVRQWQAVTYQRFGRYLVDMGDFDKARIYLKKSLRTDSHNRTLWNEVEREFNRIERQMKV